MAAIQPESPRPSREMDDPSDLVLAMFGLVMAAVMLVAATLYLVNAPDSLPARAAPPAVQTPVS